MFIAKTILSIVAIYGAFKLSGVAIAWIKEAFERMKPDKYDL